LLEDSDFISDAGVSLNTSRLIGVPDCGVHFLKRLMMTHAMRAYNATVTHGAEARAKD
jgi:hypothetical protein